MAGRYYLKMDENCNLYNLDIKKDVSGGNYINYVVSSDEKKLQNLILDVKNVMKSFWKSHGMQFIQGRYYWWITVDSKNHLKTIHCKGAIIPDNVNNQKYNYFETEHEAKQLLDLLLGVFEKYGFPLR